MITEDEFRQIFPRLSPVDRSEILPHLQSAMSEFGIGTRLRKAAFLAQVGHESGGFTRFVENLNYSAERLRKVFPKRFPNDEIANAHAHQPEKLGNFIYANRIGNGPPESGDGFRYRGRGAIQLTGRENYRKFGLAVGLDLERNPDLASDPGVAYRTAAAFWKSKGCNELADRPDFTEITKRINGGVVGLAERQAIYNRAKQVFVEATLRDVRGARRSAPTLEGIERDEPPDLSRGVYPGVEFADDEAPKKNAVKKAAKGGSAKESVKKNTALNAAAKSAGSKKPVKKGSSKKLVGKTARHPSNEPDKRIKSKGLDIGFAVVNEQE